MIKIDPNKYNEMDKLALSIISDYELFDFPIDIFHVAANLLHINLVKYSSLTKEKLLEFIKNSNHLEKGFSLIEKLSNGRNKYTIYYNDNSNIYFQRFTIAHEIKHILLNENGYTQEQEILADYFAKALLAPKCILIYENIITVQECVNKFSLSYEASSYWINGLRNRINTYGNELFAFERVFIDSYEKFKQKKD